MLIEFSCPVCQTPLALKKRAVGGQVNCPKCQKLILLPTESALPRHDPDVEPFHSSQSYKPKEVTKAICISVEPYRRDLESKVDLLNDAVELVKSRNKRIKELETLMLKTQSELWALEADVDELGDPQEAQAEQNQLAEEIETLKSEKERSEQKLANMVAHSEALNKSLQEYQNLCGEEGEIGQQVSTLVELCHLQSEALKQGTQALEETNGESADGISRLHEGLKRLASNQSSSKKREEIIQASAEEIQQALDERDQWRKKSERLEKNTADLTAQIEKLQLRVDESENMEKDWAQDRATLKQLREEMEENLELLRGRIEQEREAHREALQEREKQSQAAGEKKLAAMKKKWDQTKEELDATEKKHMESLKAQHILTEQKLASEDELGKMKKNLQQALDRIEELEASEATTS